MTLTHLNKITCPNKEKIYNFQKTLLEALKSLISI